MVNGTFGEASTLTLEEWQQFTTTLIDAVDGRVPVIAGPTTTGTRTTIQRAQFARDAGADGLLLGRPMWAKMSPEAMVEYYQQVAETVPELGIVAYENPGAFKGNIPNHTWEELIQIPNFVAAKYSGGMGAYYREIFPIVCDEIRLMPIDRDWIVSSIWYPEESRAVWSPAASCDPYPLTILREAILSGDYDTARWLTQQMVVSYQDFYPEGNRNLFHMYNIPLEKHRFNAAGYIDSGPTRPPYHVIPEKFKRGAELTGERWAELSARLKEMDEIPPKDWVAPEA